VKPTSWKPARLYRLDEAAAKDADFAAIWNDDRTPRAVTTVKFYIRDSTNRRGVEPDGFEGWRDARMPSPASTR